MSQLLNLDQLLPEEKYIVFKGENHVLGTDSVEAWLKLMAYRQQILSIAKATGSDEAAEENAAGLVDLQIKIASIACPTIPEEELRKLPMSVLMRLVEVIGEELMMGARGGEAAEGEAPTEGPPAEDQPVM